MLAAAPIPSFRHPFLRCPPSLLLYIIRNKRESKLQWQLGDYHYKTTTIGSPSDAICVLHNTSRNKCAMRGSPIFLHSKKDGFFSLFFGWGWKSGECGCWRDAHLSGSPHSYDERRYTYIYVYTGESIRPPSFLIGIYTGATASREKEQYKSRIGWRRRAKGTQKMQFFDDTHHWWNHRRPVSIKKSLLLTTSAATNWNQSAGIAGQCGSR